jgi:hypothetical protein
MSTISSSAIPNPFSKHDVEAAARDATDDEVDVDPGY